MTTVTNKTAVLPYDVNESYPSGDLDDLPDSVLRLIILFNISSVNTLITQRFTSKRFYFILSYYGKGINKIWKDLCLIKWPHISQKLKVSRWDQMYKLRVGLY